MRVLKDSQFSRITQLRNGNIHKIFRGPSSSERFMNEVCILKHLQDKGCRCVPQLIRANRRALAIETACVGSPVEHISDERFQELLDELEACGVVQEDRRARNITYDPQTDQYFLTNFEDARLQDRSLRFTQSELMALTAGIIGRSPVEGHALADAII